MSEDLRAVEEALGRFLERRQREHRPPLAPNERRTLQEAQRLLAELERDQEEAATRRTQHIAELRRAVGELERLDHIIAEVDMRIREVRAHVARLLAGAS